MATTVARLEAILSAQTRDFDRAMDKSQSRMGRMGKAAGAAGLAIAGGLAIAMTKSVKQALEAEKSQVRLETAFKDSGIAIKPYTKQIENASKAAMKLGFDDEALQDSIGSLIVATGDYTKAQEASNVAMDLARFKGIDLEGATKMLTMAMAGSQRAVKQLGISVSPLTTEYDKLKVKFGENVTESEKVVLANAKLIDKQATAAKTIEIVSQKVGGQAEAYAQTAAGGMEVFRVQMEELQENLGKTLLPALVKVTGALIVMLDWLQKHPKAVKALVVALGALAAAMITASAAQLALNLAVLANPYVAATVAIIALAGGVALLYAKVSQLRPVIEQVALTFIGLPLPLRILIGALGGVANTVDKLRAAFNALWSAIKKVIDGIKWLKDHIPDIPSIPGIRGSGEGNSHGALGGLQPRVSNAVIVASQNGWRGRVTSGFRTYQQQAALYQRYLAGGPLAARPGTSSHESGSAVDVSDYSTFGRIMSGMPSGMRLYNRLGARDPVHYSISGYAKGGTVPGPRGWPQLAVVHGGETITPAGGGGMVFNFPNYVGSKSELISWLQNAARQFRRQNGRSMF